MAARGERINLKEIEDDANSKAEKKTTATKQQQQQPATNSNPTATNIEQPQQIAGAEITTNSSIPSQTVFTPTAPVATPNAPVTGGAMPQALLGSGAYHICQQDSGQLANDVISARRRSEEPHDELVLRWLLHRLARRPTEGVCQHAGGWMKLCNPLLVNEVR